MLTTMGQRRRRLTFLEEYAERLGTVVQRHQAHAALIESRRQAMEAASLSRRALVEVREASNAKSAFLASVSHELRTPLNAVIGFAEIIENQEHGPIGIPDYIDCAREIRESGLHLLAVINDILDLAKIEAGKLRLDEGAVELGRLVESAMSMLRERARTDGVTLVKASLAQVPPILADERRLKQVLINLLSNAVKFTPSGGTVRVEVTGGGADQGLAIAVADTGIGIAAEDLDRVFQPFFQAGNTLTRHFEGTGLGLPLSKAIVELHGGTLTLASQPGVGTTATIHLPPDRLPDLRRPG